MNLVETRRKDAVLEIVLNRPERLNALHPPLVAALDEALESARDPAVRAVLIRGEGRAFCVGGDIKFFDESRRRGEVPTRMAEALHVCIEAMRDLPKPVLATVHGPCAGAGMSLALACDLVIASDDAIFNLAYLGIGLSPDGGSTHFVPRNIGTKRAFELFASAKTLSAVEALELGLINRVATPERLLVVANQLATQLAAGPTAALARMKALLRVTLTNSLHQQLALEAEGIIASARTEDFSRGIQAFLAKKIPTFVGS